MTLQERLARGDRILTEGSVYELLRRDPSVVFDDHIAHAGLIYDARSREILAAVHRNYLSVGASVGLPMLALTDTWRASGERVAASRFAGREVNRDNVEFLREIAAGSSGEVYVAALTGPRGDAYRPAEAPRFEEALRYHEKQIGELAASRVDLLVAATLPAFEEARAIAKLMAASGVLWTLSFVVREDATLLDGTPLGVAIRKIDDASAPVLGYSINCVHPTIAASALRQLDVQTRGRLIALQANTSARSPEELDTLEEIETEEPERFATMIAALDDFAIVGGCCGSDVRHIEALAQKLKRGAGALARPN